MATSTLGSGTLVLAGTTSGTTTVTATAVAGTTTLTLPAATDTLVGRATTDTLTNKTLTSPTITGGALNGTVGATTASTGAFTTLTSTGASSFATSSGDVGIGTSSPASKLEVIPVADSLFTGGLRVSRYSGGNLQYGTMTNNGGLALTVVETAVGTPVISFHRSSNGTTTTESARIDSSGNLLVGTTTVNNANTDVLTVGKTSNSQDVSLVVRQFGNNTAASINIVANDDNGAPYNYIASSTQGGTTHWKLGGIAGFTGGLAISTSGSERARIDSSGNLLVRKTALGLAVGTSIDANTSTGSGVRVVSSASTSSADGFQMYSTGAGAYRFYVSFDGTISATTTTISAISDARFKENVRDLDAGLSEVMALKPRLFDWKEGKGADIKNARGFIAQEFEEVFPDLIDKWKDPAPEGEEPYKSVRQDLIPVLVKAIQEQQALITQLTARITALESA